MYGVKNTRMLEKIKEVKNDLSEEDIKAFEENQENEQEKEGEEKKEASKESDETIEEKSSIANPEKENLGDGLKDVQGETPKERALRAELTRIRRSQREKDQASIIKTEPIIENNDADEDLKKLGYDDEQIIGLKKVVDIIASKQGYVKKSASMKEMADETLNSFIGEHPEYAPENDKDDLYWGRFKSILNSDYNLNGKTSTQLKSIFLKVDRDVKEELGEKEFKKDKIDAQKRKINDISHGSSASSKADETTKKAVSAGNKTFVSSSHPGLVFKGFDEDEMEDILT